MKTKTTTKQRVDITLPPQTLRLIEQWGEENRSAFINDAVRSYVQRLQRARLRKKLKEGYQATALDDLRTADEWDRLGEEAWELLGAEERE